MKLKVYKKGKIHESQGRSTSMTLCRKTKYFKQVFIIPEEFGSVLTCKNCIKKLEDEKRINAEIAQEDENRYNYAQ